MNRPYDTWLQSLGWRGHGLLLPSLLTQSTPPIKSQPLLPYISRCSRLGIHIDCRWKSFCYYCICINNHNCTSGPTSSAPPTVVLTATESNAINSYFRGLDDAATSTLSATTSMAISQNALSAPVQNRAAFERKRKAASELLLAKNAIKTAEYSNGNLEIPANKYPLAFMGASVNRSWIWNNFKKIDVKVGTNEDILWAEPHASCNICHERALVDATVKWAVSHTSQHSPGHLQRHLKHLHNELRIEKRVALTVHQKQDKCITSFYKKHLKFEETYLKYAQCDLSLTNGPHRIVF